MIITDLLTTTSNVFRTMIYSSRSIFSTLVALTFSSAGIFSFATTAHAGFEPQFKDRVKAEVVRAKRTRIEGGDFDDKIDRVAMSVKMTNGDTSRSFEGLTGTLLVFGTSQRNKKILKVTMHETFPVDLVARGKMNYKTKEIKMGWDNTGAIWGYKYTGWLLVVTDEEGKIVLQKATTPRFLKLADQLSSAKVDSLYKKSSMTATSE